MNQTFSGAVFGYVKALLGFRVLFGASAFPVPNKYHARSYKQKKVKV